MTELRAWLKENHALVYFLLAQAIALGAVAASIIAYSTRLESRVATLEARGAPPVAERLGRLEERMSGLDYALQANKASIDRIVDILTRELKKP